MAGCGGGTDSTEPSGPTTTLAPDKYPVPAESYKIGVVVFSNTDLEQQATNEYLKDYLAPKFNVEFIFSEDIDDADAEMTFLENCAAAGCKGILAYPVDRPEGRSGQVPRAGYVLRQGREARERPGVRLGRGQRVLRRRCRADWVTISWAMTASSSSWTAAPGG